MCCPLPLGLYLRSAPPVVDAAALRTSQPAGGFQLRPASCHAGPFKGKQRMFAWNAPNTYYRELSGGGLMGPSPDQDSEDYFRTDAPPKVSGAHSSAAGLTHPATIVLLHCASAAHCVGSAPASRAGAANLSGAGSV